MLSEPTALHPQSATMPTATSLKAATSSGGSSNSDKSMLSPQWPCSLSNGDRSRYTFVPSSPHPYPPPPTRLLTANPASSPVTLTNASSKVNIFPPPKTDKPRPHICATCERSFARLEHLKRHERSHTKEKPFECPECSRCFARRDLLLRHQQKLHMTTTPSRPRNRRESAASTTGRVRKGSVANAHGPAAMRPRANTISHVEAAHMQLMAAGNTAASRSAIAPGHSRHHSIVGLPMQNEYPFGGMSSALGHRGGSHHGLPKLETHSFNNADFGGGLRTAPPMGGFNLDFDFEGLPFGSGSATINPNALHYNDSPQSMAIDSVSPYHQTFADMSASQVLDENFDWMSGFEHQMSFNGVSENAIDGSSPSAISTASQSGISEVMLDGSNNPAANTPSMWQPSMMAPPLMTPNPFTLDLGTSGFSDIMNGGGMSPHSLPQKNMHDPYFSTPPPSLSSLSPSMMPGLTTQAFHPPANLGPETPRSMSGSMHSYPPLATITDSTRQSIVAALARCTPFGSRKYSFTATSSPLSPHFPGRSNSVSEAGRGLPSTQDLQRYIGAYIRYFHPHLPFLHIATLSFDVSASSNDGRSSSIGGIGCLTLSMAAIGALYETEVAQSKELFESSKKLIQLYLEERRKADVRKADHRKAGVDHGARLPENSVHTPVWLVQSMLLNVVYGHNCGDKVAGDIASTHCAALVSLARAAELLKPQLPSNGQLQQDVEMGDDDLILEQWNSEVKVEIPDEQQEWYNWKAIEERKRTLYSVFILSSLLVSAYNHTPALTNSEIMLDLPCDEEFWSAESANSFYAKGGVRRADHNQITFHDALGELLRTSEKQQHQHVMAHSQSFGSNVNTQELPKSDLNPSTFGCLVLINALHNYIWETRQRHHNKIWTNEETEKMHRHIEPALKAWQVAWASNPHHSLERPNPFGLGPLSADSIPLLDLAYVRLFVNLSRSKEKFWQRDFDGMAEELSRGSEIIQHAEQTPDDSDPSDTSTSSSVFVDTPPTSDSSEFNIPSNLGLSVSNQSGNPRPEFNSGHQMTNQPGSSLKRERHLRKAAFYAADSLSMSDKLGLTFADFTSRELPLQSALCAFDCAQVLAEWVATVQERVGRYLGILGKDDIDLSQVPGIMLLEEEDCKLLSKIQEVLNSADVKMNSELSGTGSSQMNPQRLSGADDCGYGSRILRVTAYMLDKAAVWPVTHVMAHCLETQANRGYYQVVERLLFHAIRQSQLHNFLQRSLHPKSMHFRVGELAVSAQRIGDLILLLLAVCNSYEDEKMGGVIVQGIGSTGGVTDKVLGGATGAGISEHIREAYAFIVNNYNLLTQAEVDDETKPQDHIILLGFSRGAFTARAIASLISDVGLLTKMGMESFWGIFGDWMNQNMKGQESAWFQGRYGVKIPFTDPKYRGALINDGLTRWGMPIKAVCVWDTVGALGVPMPWDSKEVKAYSFVNSKVSRQVEHAFHALALDEHRNLFTPTLWEMPTGDHHLNILKQCWFPGVHSNIGGSYPDAGISNIALGWMISQLEENDGGILAFDHDYIDWLQDLNVKECCKRKEAIRPWAMGRLYSSSTGFFGVDPITRTPGRYFKVNNANGQPTNERMNETGESIHRCVRVRIDGGGLGEEGDEDNSGIAVIARRFKKMVGWNVNDHVGKYASAALKNYVPPTGPLDASGLVWESKDGLGSLPEEALGKLELRLLQRSIASAAAPA
ncbi:hypothetical protein B7494_g7413 [Chlorociboria aeruginascens]|nr:hypothetical protein B7494_g7413 [Chlorociboria aeruginascens]